MIPPLIKERTLVDEVKRDLQARQTVTRPVLDPLAVSFFDNRRIYANPVIMGGLFPNGKYVGM